MNPQELQQKIAEYYEKLPPEAQKAFSDMNWMETLKTISGKYSLNNEQIEILGTETTLALLGIVHPDEYEKELISQLKIQKETIDKMIEEINEQILKPVRPQLGDTFNSNVEKLGGLEEIPLPPYIETNSNNQTPKTISSTPPPNLPVMSASAQIGPIQDSEKDLGVMKDAGIEIINEKPSIKNDEERMTMREDKLLVKSGISLIEEKPMSEGTSVLPNTTTQKSTLYGIEHPQNTMGNLIKEKLKGVSTNTATVSNHNLSNNTPSSQPSNFNPDKYHEPI